MLLRPFVYGLLALFLAACGSTRDTRVDLDAADSVTGTGLQSMDIRTMAQRFSAALQADGILAPGKEGDRVSFYVTQLRNDSSDVIDKELILVNLRTALFKSYGRRVRFLDRSPEANELVDAEVGEERERHGRSYSTDAEQQPEEVTRRAVGEAEELL